MKSSITNINDFKENVTEVQYLVSYIISRVLIEKSVVLHTKILLNPKSVVMPSWTISISHSRVNPIVPLSIENPNSAYWTPTRRSYYWNSLLQ